MGTTHNAQRTTHNAQRTNFKLLVFLTLFSVFSVFSQTNNGVGLNYSPAGSLETVFDNYGVKRTLEDVRISPKKDVRSNERILFSTQLCSSGIFDLYFEDGSGMNSTTNSNHIARRAVVCQVFQDLSNFINAPAGTRINFWVRNISQVPNVSSQTLGVATGFYNLPSTSIATNFSIADNEIWKTIHAGVDSYTNVTSPITSTAGLGSFYHGMMAINFNNLNWNLNLNATALSNQLDLYTVVLHEVTHALGFASLIDANGNSKFGENFDYYSRYDTFLVDHESKPLITNQNSCNEMYNFQFTVDQNVLHPNCTNSPDFTNTGASINATVCINSLGFLGDSVYVPIYTPQCFENGSSLSHFEDQCFTSTTAGATNGNDLYFVMSNANNYGINKRFLKPEEREALCNMGYRLNSTFGNTAQHSFINYGGLTCNGSTVAGINDGINGLDFSYIVNISTPIQLNPITSRILANDVTTNPANLRFECVEDISFTGSTINVIGNDTNASITFQSPTPGMHLLRYVPFDISSGNRGNITYIYVFVSGMSTANPNGDGPNTSTFNCAIPSTCNLVLNGDFEQNANPPGPPSVTSQINRACGWTNGNQAATCDYFRTNAVAHTNGTIYMSIPNNFAGNQNVNNGVGNGYAGIYYIQNLQNTQILYSEILATRLAQPLLPNSTYKLNLDVSMAESFSNINRRIQLQAYLGFNAPFQNPNNYDLPIETNGILLTNAEFSSNINGWDTLNIEFNTGDIAGQEYLYIGGIQNVSFENIPLSNLDVRSYYYIDNVSLIPIPNEALNLPTQICQSSQLANLTDYLGVIPNDGVFTGDGVILDHNIYTFNPTNLPTGVATINYTYNLSNGCGEITISDTIIITQTCVVPYVSQVYNNGEGNSFIEVKNPSTTDSIEANTYFLNLYQDGASTTLMPTSFIDIGLLLPNEARVFQTSTASNPAYATGIATVLPLEFVFDGNQDILTISTTTDVSSYNFRTDLAGNSTDDWSTNASLVRSGCATTVPRIDAFDYDDWARFELLEIDNVYTEFSRTNPVLGRHHQEQLSFDVGGQWRDQPNNFDSFPERSRFAQINTTYNTNINGSFECCSLDLRREQLIINENDYVSIENNLVVHDDTNLRIENNGSLVMVKDQFNGIQGNELIQILGNGQVRTARTTVGLDATTDYVYWSTPLANIPANSSENTPNTLFPSPPFNSSRFFEFINANYQDIPDVWQSPNNANGANGYDDNLDDYHILSPIQRAQQLTAGLGYATWTPAPGTNYTVTFRGKPNNGIVTVPVYHKEPSNSFANLVGNPYPSAINLDRLFEVNAGLINPVAYIWGRKVDDTPNNPSSGPYGLNYTEDSYLIYNPTMIVVPSSSSNSAFNDNDFNGISDNGVLASCQSFFVQTVTHTPDYDYNSSLVFNNSIRSKVVNNTFARNSISENQDKLWIDFYNNNLKSQVGIAFLDKGSDGFNSKEDVKKMFDSKLNIYTNTTNYDLIIDVQSKFNSNKKIPLKLKTVEFENQEFKIEINKSSGKLAQENIYLEDKLLNVIYDLSKSPYTFKLDSNITNDRFVILFNKENDSANSNLTYNQISNNQCWSKISVNESWHCNAVKNDGTLWAWGFNDSGQVGDFQCNLVGANCIGQFQIGTETIWEDVTTGSKRSFAKKSNGTLWAWGNNQNGALGISSSATTINTPTQIGTENNWSTIKSFAGSTFAIKQNGTLWAWGANGSGQLGDGTTTNRTTPIQVSLSSNWSKITVGTNHALALKSDGTLWSWGYNYYGALGNGSNVNIIVPTQVGSDNNWVEISAGGNFSMSIKNDGTLWSWGKNDSGQLGQNNLININVPTQVGVENNWYKIISSNQHCLALKVNNTLWAWGYNNGYRLGDGTITNRLLPIQIGTAYDWAKINAGGASSMGIKNDNSLFVWGYNNCGQLGTNDNVSLQIPTQIECLQLSNNQFNTNKITIYPNPTKNTLNITTTTPLQKTIIYNLLGAKVYEQAFNESIDISNLASGVYVVKFYSEDNVVFVEKIVKE